MNEQMKNVTLLVNSLKLYILSFLVSEWKEGMGNYVMFHRMCICSALYQALGQKLRMQK